MDEEYERIFTKLKEKGVYGVALVSREGMVMYSDLPSSVHEETFGIMVATMVGAGKTANSELNRSPISKIIVDSPEGRIIATSPRKKDIIAVVVDSTFKLAPLFNYLSTAVKNIGN